MITRSIEDTEDLFVNDKHLVKKLIIKCFVHEQDLLYEYVNVEEIIFYYTLTYIIYFDFCRFKNLKSLRINSIDSSYCLENLCKCENLKALKIFKLQVQDITPLKKLVNLESFSLINLFISIEDKIISFLKELKNLRKICLGFRLKDLEWLKDLESKDKIKTFHIPYCYNNDISPITSLTNLTSLNLGHSFDRSIKCLKNLNILNLCLSVKFSKVLSYLPLSIKKLNLKYYSGKIDIILRLPNLKILIIDKNITKEEKDIIKKCKLEKLVLNNLKDQKEIIIYSFINRIKEKIDNINNDFIKKILTIILKNN